MTLTQQKLAERDAARNRPRQRRLPELANVLPLPPFALSLSPPPLRTASADFADALSRLSEARGVVADAKQALLDARRADEHEPRTAARKGKAPKPENVADAREAVREAERMLPAVKYAAREAQAEFLATLREHREEVAEA